MGTPDFHNQRANSSIPRIYISIYFRQICDSPWFYGIFSLVAVIIFVLTLKQTFWSRIDFINFTKGLIESAQDFLVLLPPFVLAIIAMFPAFSEATKRKLRELGNGEPTIAPFLDQFVFIIWHSLVLLVLSKLIAKSGFFESLAVRGPLAVSFLNVAAWVYFLMFLTLLWEIFDGVKSMYVLILREYKS